VKKKKKWGKIQLLSVKLKPEQAVLSCCDQISRGPNPTIYGQCWWGAPGCMESDRNDAISS